MTFTENLLVSVVTEVLGSPEVKYQGATIVLTKPFKRMLWNDLVKEASGLDYESASTDDFAARAKELGVVVEKMMTKSTLADEIYKKTLRQSMMEPVFVINHPLELSPLSKKITPASDKVARFQLLIGGFELTNAFSELNDPIDQQERFAAQQSLREKGDTEAHRVDDQFPHEPCHHWSPRERTIWTPLAKRVTMPSPVGLSTYLYSTAEVSAALIATWHWAKV